MLHLFLRNGGNLSAVVDRGSLVTVDFHVAFPVGVSLHVEGENIVFIADRELIAHVLFLTFLNYFQRFLFQRRLFEFDASSLTVGEGLGPPEERKMARGHGVQEKEFALVRG